MDLNEIKELLKEKYDPDDIAFILNLSTADLVETFDYKIEAMFDKLVIEFNGIQREEEYSDR